MAGPAASFTQPVTDHPRILVVDDEPSICLIVSKTLSNDPYIVETTTHAQEALYRLEHEPFDLLITDIRMPGIDGLELAERARATDALLGIVIMSAYGSYEHLARALRTGSTDFIQKPFNLDELRLAVHRALERRQLQRDNVRLQTLVKVFEYSQTINSTLELNALCAAVGEIVASETAATSVGIWTVDRGELRIESGSSLLTPLAEAAHALAREAYTQHQPEPICCNTADADAAHETILCAVPLIVSEERVGVLVATYAVEEPPFLELLRIIANLTAPAIRNARQYRVLQELDQMKSEFIGIASHELRTPLSLVLGYSSLLRNRLEGRDRDALQQVINGALRIGDIIDDLVNLRHSDAGQTQLDLMQLDLWAMLREVVAELEPLAQSRQVSLELVHPPELLLIDADRDKLQLALAHLIDNATKFTPPGGAVNVVGLPLDPNTPNEAVIEVRDTGIGMDQRELSRIFERFYQAAPSATRVHSGLGIGLAVTKMLIELHGGRIQVQTRPGRGSVFQVRLPLRVAGTNATPQS